MFKFGKHDHSSSTRPVLTPRSYRTLSIHVDDQVDEKGAKGKRSKRDDPAVGIRNIDVHLITPDEVLSRFSTSTQVGLDSSAVQRRAKLGRNVISPPPTHYWKKVVNYVFGGFNFLMWIAFIVTIVRPSFSNSCSELTCIAQLSYQPLGGNDPAAFNLGVAVLLVSIPPTLSIADAMLIALLQLLVIVVSATFYALVDWHASRIMKSIKSLIAEEATVVRDGEQQTINSMDVVVGDVVALRMGDRVPADTRLIEVSSDVRFDRSLLTGERYVCSTLLVSILRS